LNPRTLGPMANTITIRPPRTTTNINRQVEATIAPETVTQVRVFTETVQFLDSRRSRKQWLLVPLERNAHRARSV
jgi:hypothetical protein